MKRVVAAVDYGYVSFVHPQGLMDEESAWALMGRLAHEEDPSFVQRQELAGLGALGAQLSVVIRPRGVKPGQRSLAEARILPDTIAGRAS